MSMNIIVKAAERETRGPKTDSGIFLPTTRWFMDDLTVTTSSQYQEKWILLALEEVVASVRMKFKPKKSRSIILRKDQITTKFQLKIQGEEIPTIVDNPIKYLGKWFDDILKDNSNVKTIQTQVAEWFKKVDKSGLPGKFKAWIYQHSNNNRSHRKKDKQCPQKIARSTTKIYSHRSLQSIITNPATFNINFGGIQVIKEQTCNDYETQRITRSTGLRNDTFPTVVKGKTKREEQHDVVRNKTSIRRTKKGKNSRVKPPRSMDEVELARKKDHTGRVMEDGSIQNFIHA
ncbi:unnamed protein product [Mytilus coruscus]|uniref:Reverse transcriptase domain-containing protein n=1 Tax=Mytilus coruscus TaxID=42192 RepID=A0A6J8BNY9_MYTCO|nr:unnamed protein product [Mytilus coruscus]